MPTETFAVLAAVMIAWIGAPPAIASEEARDVVAAQIRLQGYRCDAPKSARRDAQGSRPDEAAWILECRNMTYRVRLIPHKAAEVEMVEPR
jgi:hypothetical protein